MERGGRAKRRHRFPTDGPRNTRRDRHPGMAKPQSRSTPECRCVSRFSQTTPRFAAIHRGAQNGGAGPAHQPCYEGRDVNSVLEGAGGGLSNPSWFLFGPSRTLPCGRSWGDGVKVERSSREQYLDTVSPRADPGPPGALATHVTSLSGLTRFPPARDVPPLPRLQDKVPKINLLSVRSAPKVFRSTLKLLRSFPGSEVSRLTLPVGLAKADQGPFRARRHFAKLEFCG